MVNGVPQNTVVSADDETGTIVWNSSISSGGKLKVEKVLGVPSDVRVSDTVNSFIVAPVPIASMPSVEVDSVDDIGTDFYNDLRFLTGLLTTRLDKVEAAIKAIDIPAPDFTEVVNAVKGIEIPAPTTMGEGGGGFMPKIEAGSVPTWSQDPVTGEWVDFATDPEAGFHVISKVFESSDGPEVLTGFSPIPAGAILSGGRAVLPAVLSRVFSTRAINLGRGIELGSASGLLLEGGLSLLERTTGFDATVDIPGPIDVELIPSRALSAKLELITQLWAARGLGTEVARNPAGAANVAEALLKSVGREGNIYPERAASSLNEDGIRFGAQVVSRYGTEENIESMITSFTAPSSTTLINSALAGGQVASLNPQPGGSEPAKGPSGKGIPVPIGLGHSGSVVVPDVPETLPEDRDIQSEVVMALESAGVDDNCMRYVKEMLNRGRVPQFDTFKDKECYEQWKKVMMTSLGPMLQSSLRNQHQ